MKAFKQKIRVGRHTIGGTHTFVTVEIGLNHQGKVSLAKKLIDASAAAGVDAVKFQAFKVDEFVANRKVTYTYTLGNGKKITELEYDMFKRSEFTERQFREVFAYAKKKRMLCFATPQNVSDMEMLRRLGAPLLKVGSDDLTNLPLHTVYARTKLPTIVSTGMGDLGEIKDVAAVYRKAGNDKLVILHCISSYPAEAEELNLLRIGTIRKSIGVITGFSDHSDGSQAAIAAVTLGARVIEKHITLDRNMVGPDHRFALEPDELKKFVSDIRFAEEALGSPEVRSSAKELTMRKIARRSIAAAHHIASGERITEKTIEYKRPGTGLMPKWTPKIVGKIAKHKIAKGSFIRLSDIK